MDLSPFEQHVFAYFVANGAETFTMVPRWWPYGELVLVLEDKIRVATRKFGTKAGTASPKVARALLDLLIEREAFSTKQSDLGSAMHQFQPDAYRAVIKQLQETDPIVRNAQAGGPEFWQRSFADLG